MGPGHQAVRSIPHVADRVTVGEHGDRHVHLGRGFGRSAGHAGAKLLGEPVRPFGGAVVHDELGPAPGDRARHGGSHPPAADDRDPHRVASSVRRTVSAIRSADGICASSRTGFAASGTCGEVIRTTGPSRE